MTGKNVNEDKSPSSEELKVRWQALAASVEAMGKEGGKLLSALEPGYLPDSVLREIEAKTRPFTASIREMQAQAIAFQEYAQRFDESVAARQRAANYEAFWATPNVSKAVN